MRFNHTVPAKRHFGFTLAEVTVAVSIVALTFATVIYGYVSSTDRAEWSAYSLAAQSLASQAIEQARAAKWDVQAWPPVDELGTTNYMSVEQLDVPPTGDPVYATNYVSVTTVTNSPQLRQLRADCVWMLPSRKPGSGGPFTNTAVTFRASDQ